MILSKEEWRLLAQLRNFQPVDHLTIEDVRSRSEKMADAVTSIVGSWRFLIIQSVLLVVWLLCNVLAYVQHWDPYPFILLNLILSFQAAYTAPIIMMSQNREAAIDRKKMDYNHTVNVKSELEIELLHTKVDKILRYIESQQQKEDSAANNT